MASFFKKINPNNNNKNNKNNTHHSSKINSPNTSNVSSKLPKTPQLTSNNSFGSNLNSNSIFDSPPISSLPSPPVNHLKDDLNKLKNINKLIDHNNNNNNNTATPTPPTTSNNSDNRQQIHLKSPDSKSIENDRSNSNLSTPWKKKKLYNSPFPRFGHTVSSLTSNSGACYLMGGLSGNNVYGDMWIIEPIRKNNLSSSPIISSSYIASPIENPEKIPSPRTGHASILIGNAFIIFAGDTAINYDQSLDNNLYFFNISSLKWTITSPIGLKPCGRYGHQISVLNFQLNKNNWSSQLFVFGGQLNDKYFNDLWKFDLTKFKDSNNKWIKINSNGLIPPNLSNHSMTAYNNKLFIYGGHNNELINDNLYCYNAIENNWTICNIKGPFKPPPLFGHSSSIFGSLLFIFGGKLSDDENSGDLYIIDVLTFKCWKLQSNLPFSPGPRYGHSITINPIDEKLIIMGGDVYDNDFNGIEEESSINLIDEAKFSLLSSVIYELDIKKLEEFLDKSESHYDSNNNNNNKNDDVINNKNHNSSHTFPSTFNKDSVENSKSNINLTDSPIDNTKNDTIENIENDLNNDPIISSTPIQTTDDEDYVSLNEENEKINIKENNNNRDEKKNFDNNNNNNNYSHNKSIDRTSDSKFNDLSDDLSDNNKNETILTSNSQTDLVNDSILYKTPESNNERSNKTKQDDQIKPDILDRNIKKFNEIDKELDNDNDKEDDLNHITNFTTPSIVPFNNSTIPFSPALAERDNVKIQRLIQMVNDIKSEMKLSVSQANSQIIKLENEKNELIEKLNSKNDGNNEISNLIEKNTELQDFIKNELSIIPDLNSLINEQKLQIDLLNNKIIENESLNDKIIELKNENLKLTNEIENSKIKDQINQLSSINLNLNNLSKKWNEIGPENLNKVKEFDLIKKENSNLVKQLNESNNKLEEFEILFNESKNSLNKSHKALLLSQSETNKLKDKINILSNELDELRMKKRVYSNSSSRKISTSNNNTNNSTMISKSDSISSEILEKGNNSNNSNNNNKFEVNNGDVENEHNNTNELINDIKYDSDEDDLDHQHSVSLIDDRYEIKIKDLEANLFIVSQERDQMRQELITLKKQMYNTRNNSSFINSSHNI